MTFSDIHTHILSGTDDGAKTETDMQQLIDAAYADGIRWLWLTPHFHPGYFGDNRHKGEAAFAALAAYASERYPDLQLLRGNELFYSRDCLSWLEAGLCRTMNDTRFLLVDFSEQAESSLIHKGLERLLNGGYIPLLAHAERYAKLQLADIRALKRNGVWIQINAQSPFRQFGFRAQRQVKAILGDGLADFVASDTHDIRYRPPQMTRCHTYIAQKYGAAYADALCRDNALRLLMSRDLGKE